MLLNTRLRFGPKSEAFSKSLAFGPKSDSFLNKKKLKTSAVLVGMVVVVGVGVVVVLVVVVVVVEVVVLVVGPPVPDLLTPTLQI